ncbi:type I glyceraldehyde-3-phosphate dehydrogenase [Lacisediminihabitans profunda]|uniref:Aldehyde dehydrogenase n=1 Tax=Lacisediminihabitans profunda TaxID=2594790 RepID=A0A5C8UJF5_9MICO|nr:glyceraldehyde 3-phosphate dehydrogenase NAD-binding domain-containing protein [Lacisediminihabitans profunda]TXN28329.1 aldehyde dehydrogenase [Lacisediminihabitans profunda]
MDSIAIYGLGRIGRQLLRSAVRNDLFVPKVVCDIAPAGTLAALLEVDTNYGRWPGVTSDEGSISVDGRRITYLNSRESLPQWGELGVDLVVDCSGRAVTREVARLHLENGAKRVLVSGPSATADDCDAVLLPGINLDDFDAEAHKIISMASCTTNALAAVVKVLLESTGIRHGVFSTVHAYTNTQSLTDQPMKSRRDSWAGAENIIPSSSGAAKALGFIWPDLKITGKAYRVPVRTGSIVELNAVPEREISTESLRDLFRSAATAGPLKGILDTFEDEWTSARVVGDPHSSIVDLPLTQSFNGLISVAAWYDNEAGFSMRLAETAVRLAS